MQDRSAIQTANAETTVTEPRGLQALIDKAVEAVPSGLGHQAAGASSQCQPAAPD